MSRCLYNSSFDEFISADENLIFGVIDGGAHGVTLTTAKEAWKAIRLAVIQIILHSKSCSNKSQHKRHSNRPQYDFL